MVEPSVGKGPADRTETYKATTLTVAETGGGGKMELK